jgi:hypothetical protein
MERLHHEHIICVYDVFRDKDTITLVLEYAPHGDLRAQIGLRRLGVPEGKVCVDV